MKVILLQDIDKLGKKYEIKNVADGYARNFLIPKSLVRPLNESNMRWLEEQKLIATKKSEESLKNTQDVASKIDGLELFIPVKVGDKKQLFESVGEQKISETLQVKGFNIKKSQIKLENPLKDLGEFPVTVELDHGLESQIRVIITEEEQEKEEESREVN